MKWLRRILITLLAVLFLIIGIGFLLPSHAHVERSITINRPTEYVYTVLNDMRQFNQWSPWYDLDPNAQYTISDNTVGVGAQQSWVGDPQKVGSGTQIITESTPNEQITTTLDFGEHGKATATYSLKSENSDTATQVIWGFDSDLPLEINRQFLWNLMGRYMALSFDSMIGADYERGLNKLKTVVEKIPVIDFGDTQFDVIELTSQKALVIPGESRTDTESSAVVLGHIYGIISEYASANNLSFTGAPFTQIKSHDKDTWAFDAGIPLPVSDIPVPENAVWVDTASGKAVRVLHIGSYNQLIDTHNKLNVYLQLHGWQERGARIEQYISDPGITEEASLITQIIQPIE